MGSGNGEAERGKWHEDGKFGENRWTQEVGRKFNFQEMGRTWETRGKWELGNEKWEEEAFYDRGSPSFF